jgi:pSer/pThr/pTyr-binding forkhead associated (FHA) protein
LQKTVLTLGRAADNDIVIDDAEVSRHHARLTLQGNNRVLEDLGSRNGTFVNGQRITGPVPLTPDDEVALVPDVLFSVEGGAPVEARPEPEKPAPPLASATAPPKPKGGLPGWAFVTMGGLGLICIVVAVVTVASLMWLSGGPDEKTVEMPSTFTPVVVVTAPPTNTPPSVVEPTPTPPPVESELAQFEDTSGLFELRYPVTLSQVEPSTEQGDYGYTLAAVGDDKTLRLWGVGEEKS